MRVLCVCVCVPYRVQQRQHLERLAEPHAVRQDAAAAAAPRLQLRHALEARVPHELHALVLHNEQSIILYMYVTR